MKFKIGIDIDNTITASTESVVFFALLTNALKDKADIYIITNRSTEENDIKETKQELSQMDIYYDELIITPNKEKVIIEKGINIFFDDTDENFQNLPESVQVFKTREPMNFDFNDKKWVYGQKTGKMI